YGVEKAGAEAAHGESVSRSGRILEGGAPAPPGRGGKKRRQTGGDNEFTYPRAPAPTGRRPPLPAEQPARGSIGVLGWDRRGTGLTVANVFEGAVGMPELVLQGPHLGDVGRVVVRVMSLARRRVADRRRRRAGVPQEVGRAVMRVLRDRGEEPTGIDLGD